MAQTVFVSADNGLNVRNDATLSAPKVGKFFYGDQLNILARNYTKVVVMEGDKRIDGDWIRVSGINENNELLEGYVFDGYTTEEYLNKPLKLNLTAGKAIFKNADGWVEEVKDRLDKTYISSDAIGFSDDVLLKIEAPNNSKVEVFQRIVMMVNLNHQIDRCASVYDLNVTADWKKLKDSKLKRQYSPIVFTSEKYDIMYQMFWKNAKKTFSDDCGDSYQQFLKIAQTEMVPFSLYPMSTQFKVIVTDSDGNSTIDFIESYEIEGC
jgi:hypothetical protein